jgi:hypothetical protein
MLITLGLCYLKKLKKYIKLTANFVKVLTIVQVVDTLPLYRDFSSQNNFETLKIKGLKPIKNPNTITHDTILTLV